MNRSFTLDRLRYFVALAEELHFGRAAARLGVSQPPLSLQIQKLEAEIGVPLFDRSTRRVALTAAGEALLERAQSILALADRAASEARRAASGERGSLAVGFVGSASYRLLPALLREFRQRLPEVALQLVELTSAQQVEALESGRIDAGLARAPVSASGLASRIVWREPLVAALPETHRLAGCTAIALADLRDEPFVGFPPSLGPGLHQRIVALCEAAGFAPKVRQQAVQMQTIVGLVGAGFGVAIVPDCVRDFRLRGVVYRSLAAEDAATELALIWNPERVSPSLARFIEIATGKAPYAGLSTVNS